MLFVRSTTSAETQPGRVHKVPHLTTVVVAKQCDQGQAHIEHSRGPALACPHTAPHATQRANPSSAFSSATESNSRTR
eukprot:7560993-Alexandrium_andersonii.AAC.1